MQEPSGKLWLCSEPVTVCGLLTEPLTDWNHVEGWIRTSCPFTHTCCWCGTVHLTFFLSLVEMCLKSSAWSWDSSLSKTSDSEVLVVADLKGLCPTASVGWKKQEQTADSDQISKPELVKGISHTRKLQQCLRG